MREYSGAAERLNEMFLITEHKFAGKIPLLFQWAGFRPDIKCAIRRWTAIELGEYLSQLFVQPRIVSVVGRDKHFSADPQTLVAGLNKIPG